MVSFISRFSSLRSRLNAIRSWPAVPTSCTTGLGEIRRRAGAGFQIARQKRQQLRRRVHRLIRPALFGGGAAGVDVVGIHQNDAAQRRHVFAAGAVEALGAVVDDAHAEAFMAVAREGLAAVGGLQHFQPAEIVDMHEMGLFPGCFARCAFHLHLAYLR